MNCPSCQHPLPSTSPFCPECGANLHDATLVDSSADDATLISSSHASAPSGGADSFGEGRLDPGSRLGDRYRIVAHLGTGGMGEVYRADDLTLGQSVAVKFLPLSMSADPARRDRFFAEVRTAREIAHPNVCRVYDIGEVDGRTFLTMEYVDGEDLQSLIRRIGRLPEEKAVDLARQLCAGLASLHDKGIVHRDLKPANVMLDGRGQVRITDFGLAGLAENIQGAEVRSGTPAYMAPEQLSGEEVTTRSDIYSLGLVLFELFTGRQAYEASSLAELRDLHDRSGSLSVSTHVSTLDPAVDRVISRCLQKDPSSRPPSAIALAAALPGGDPLAAALAAGETPSPELVAASGGGGGLHPGLVVAGVAAVVAALVLYAFLGSRDRLHAHVPMEHPKEELRVRARDLVEAVGYDPAYDEADGFGSHGSWIRYLARTDTTLARWDRLRESPSGVLYWYRGSPDYLDPVSPYQRVTNSDPPFDTANMVRVVLEPDGRLLSFRAIAPESTAEIDSSLVLDWDRFFSAARLDRADFSEVEPEWLPSDYADQRLAWKGSYPSTPDVELRIEAGAVGDLATYWSIRGPWGGAVRTSTGPERSRWLSGGGLSNLLFLLIWALGAGVSLKNYRAGRGDLIGANRLAGFIGVLWFANWVFRAQHVSDPNRFPDRFFLALGFSMIVASIVWSLYMALEPLVRRQWPQAMVAWTRLVRGRPRDPMVGRAILFGGVVYLGLIGLDIAKHQALLIFDVPVPSPRSFSWATLDGPAHWFATAANSVVNSMLQPMITLIFLVFLRIPLRKPWLTYVVFVSIMTGAGIGGTLSWPIDAAFAGAVIVLTVLVLAKVGFLPIVVATFFHRVTGLFPVTADGDAFYFGASTFVVILVLSLTLFGAWTALAGRSVFDDALAD